MVRVHTKPERVRDINEVRPYILIRLGKQVSIDVRKQDIMSRVKNFLSPLMSYPLNHTYWKGLCQLYLKELQTGHKPTVNL